MTGCFDVDKLLWAICPTSCPFAFSSWVYGPRYDKLRRQSSKLCHIVTQDVLTRTDTLCKRFVAGAFSLPHVPATRPLVYCIFEKQCVTFLTCVNSFKSKWWHNEDA